MANLQGAGALPFLWRATGLTARLVAVISGFAVVIYALPDGIRGLVPWLLVGLALSAGLATLGLFRDLLALIVLSLERRVVPGGQIRIGNLTGQIVSLSPRAVTLRTGDGTEVRVPNWRFLSRSVHLDRDPRAFVEFRLKISSQAPRERVHRVLEELLLLSPYAVVSGEGRPGVRPDPDDLTTWWVEARLLDARWTRDFERTLVEMANERLEN